MGKRNITSEPLEIQDKQDYLQVTYSGEFGVKSSKQVIDRIIHACAEYHRAVVLLDCRRMTGSLPILHRYQVAEYGGKTMIKKVSKIALVRKQEAGPIDLFTETVARNRGIDLKIFTDIDQAILWLRA